MSECGEKRRCGEDGTDPRAWFAGMVPRCYEHAKAAKAAGRPVVGIMCEYTPRELILAAGGVPVCLCGGSAQMIPVAEQELPANLCPLVKSTYGYFLAKANPFLEMADLLVAETTCDGKKKMYERLARGKPMHVIELPQKPDEPEALGRWLAELRKLKRALEERFGTAIGDGALRAAIRSMNRERALRRNLASILKQDRPALTGRELLEMKSLISCMDGDLAQYAAAHARFAAEKPADGWPHPVRVLLTGVPHAHGAERVMELIEANGGLVVCQENCTGLKPLLDDVDEAAADPLEAIARKYLDLPCSVMTPNGRRIDLLRKLAREYRAECVVDLVWQACLTYDVESPFVREAAEGLSLPYLKIETDYSQSDTARLALRVQALFETAAGRRAERPA